MPFFRVDKGASIVVHKHKEQTAQTTKLYQSFRASLGSGNVMRAAVRCPPGENPNTWIAMNTIELYNTTMLCYGVVSEYCTQSSCPTMSAGKAVEYRWPAAVTTADGKKKKKSKEAAQSLSAPEYVDKLADWIYTVLNDPSVFPQQQQQSQQQPDDGGAAAAASATAAYGKKFLPMCKKILGRLFRVFAHVYCQHWENVSHVGAEAHINTSFKHFYLFVTEFKLVDEADMQPLAPVIAKLRLHEEK